MARLSSGLRPAARKPHIRPAQAGPRPCFARTAQGDELRPMQAPPPRATSSLRGGAHQAHQRYSPRSRSPAPCAPSAGVCTGSAGVRRASSRAWSQDCCGRLQVTWRVSTHRMNRSLAFIGPPSSAMGAHRRLQPLLHPAASLQNLSSPVYVSLPGMHSSLLTPLLRCGAPLSEYLSLPLCILQQTYICTWHMTLHAVMARKASCKASTFELLPRQQLLVHSLAFSV